MNFWINNWRAVEKLILKLLSAVYHHCQPMWCPSFPWCHRDIKTATESLWWLMHKLLAGMAFYFCIICLPFFLPYSVQSICLTLPLEKPQAAICISLWIRVGCMPKCSHCPLQAFLEIDPQTCLLCWGSGKSWGNLEIAAHGRAWRAQLNLALSVHIWS